MKVKFFLVALILFPALSYAGSPDLKLCGIMKSAFLGTSPEDLCRKHNGAFCSSMKTMGQGICAANGKPFCDSYKSDGEAICNAGSGVFCSSIKTLAGGICSITGGNFCSDETDDAKWKAKLSESCGW